MTRFVKAASGWSNSAPTYPIFAFARMLARSGSDLAMYYFINFNERPPIKIPDGFVDEVPGLSPYKKDLRDQKSDGG